MSLRSKAKTSVKQALARWRYPHPAPELKTERLYLYLDALARTRAIPGAVVEVGCFQGATAALGMRMLRGLGVSRRYLCVDTFGGFPAEQFATDASLGTEAFLETAFSANSPALVRRLLDQWGCPEVELLPADVVRLPAAELPELIAVALIDVDLDDPTDAALRKILPRMAPGGIILVDDCDSAGFKGARVATERVVPTARYEFGMGVIEIPPR